MDFKGITWAGNIYQKFEAMCLEVEEAMYQDTIKYVENQVQKVGVSVKKFCSEVMEDLGPPSCVHPINLASGDLSLTPYGLNDIDKKPKPSGFDGLKKNENEDQVVSYVTAEKESFPSVCYDINSLSPKSPGISAHKVGLQRRPVGIKRISKNNHPSKDSSRTSRSKLASSDTRSSSSGAPDDITVMSSVDLEANRDPGVAVKQNESMPDAPIGLPAGNKILAAVSVRKNDDDLSAQTLRQYKEDLDSISPVSENNLSAESERMKEDSGSTSSCSGLPTESTGVAKNNNSFSTGVRNTASNPESEEKELLVSNEDGSTSVGTISCEAESWDKAIIMSNEDSFNMEVIENDEVSEPMQENLKADERGNLEESCILVEGDKLHCIPHETKKHKSYKKKIREALSAKLRSRMDNRCASPHKDLGGKSNEEAVTPGVSGKQILAAQELFESEWELL